MATFDGVRWAGTGFAAVLLESDTRLYQALVTNGSWETQMTTTPITDTVGSVSKEYFLNEESSARFGMGDKLTPVDGFGRLGRASTSVGMHSDGNIYVGQVALNAATNVAVPDQAVVTVQVTVTAVDEYSVQYLINNVPYESPVVMTGSNGFAFGASVSDEGTAKLTDALPLEAWEDTQYLMSPLI